MKTAKKLKSLLQAAGSVFLGGVAGFLAAPGAESYLELQQQSDAVHRFFLVAEPAAALTFLLSAMLAYIFTEFVWPKRIFSALWLGALCFGSALLVFVARFEYHIEQKGREGQWKVFAVPETVKFQGARAIEEHDGPGLAIEAAAGEINLDRRSIFLKAQDGSIRWQRKRPGSWPALILEADEHFFLALPANEYPDDLQLFMFETASGKLLWEFHVLGRKARAIAGCGQELKIIVERPGLAGFYSIDVVGVKVVERKFLSGQEKISVLCPENTP